MRRGVMLVEADAVEAELVHQLPGLNMILIGLVRDLRIEKFTGQRIGQVGEFGELLRIGHEVEQKDFHRCVFFSGKRGRHGGSL